MGAVIVALLGGGIVIAIMQYDYKHSIPPEHNRRSTDKPSSL